MPTATAPTPPALRRLGVDDPARFRVLRRVPIFDEHAPTTKFVADRRRKTASNPEGIVAIRLGATRDDLEQLARNSNARALAGRLPSLQLGHTLAYDAPEALQPRAVGFPFNFAVGEHEGRACLFADLAYRAEHYDEAATYPRGSIERSGWTTPDLQHVQALALIRCRPGRDLPAIPYAAGPDVPIGARSAWAAERQDRVDRLIQGQLTRRATEQQARAAEAARPAPPEFTSWATRNRLFNVVEARAAYAREFPGSPVAITYAAKAPAPPPRPTLVEFATRFRIFDVAEARRRYALCFPDPDAPPARYDAGPPAVTTIPSDPRALMQLRGSPAYSAARREYAERTRTFGLVQAGHDLEREVRAGLLSFDAASGRLRLPEPPTAEDPAATPTAEGHWRERRASFWAAGGAIGPDGTPRFKRVEADPRPRVDVKGTPMGPGGSPRLGPGSRKALGLDVDWGRAPNAVATPTDPNPRLPGR